MTRAFESIMLAQFKLKFWILRLNENLHYYDSSFHSSLWSQSKRFNHNVNMVASSEGNVGLVLGIAMLLGFVLF